MSGTMDCGTLYKTSMLLPPEGNTDADWTGYKADKRSTYGFVFSLGRKQYPVVVRSNQPSLFRAQRQNTGAQRWPHVKPYGSRGY